MDERAISARARGWRRVLAPGLGAAAAPLLTTLPAVAQSGGTLVGRVTSAQDGRPLSAATVLVPGTNLGALTGENGRYRIAGVPPGTARARVSALGYRSEQRRVEVPAGGRAELDVSLEVRPVAAPGIRVSVLRPDLRPEAGLEPREVREANPKDAGQLLRQLSGVDAVRRGPLGLDAVVRGLRETEVGTYLDGTRMFPAGPARMDSPLTHFDPAAVQEMEVVKGPYALTWGAGNLSAIRVETQSVPPAVPGRFHGTLATGYDTNLRAVETSGNVFGRQGAVSWWGHGVWRDGDDYESGDGQVIPGDFRSWEGRGKLGFDLGGGSRLTLGGGYQEQGPIDYPGRLLTAEFFETVNCRAATRSSGPAGPSGPWTCWPT